jgi:negative regulator of flagellin synthesis FlgM
MTDPVNNSSRINSGIAGTTSAKPARASTSERTSSSATAASSSADANTESNRLQQVRERINATPEVDLAKVEAIKLALAEGRLPLDPQRIAQKFADLEGLLGN